MSPLFVFLNHADGQIGAVTILEKDPYGLTVAFISISVVLSVLFVLTLMVSLFSKAISALSNRKAKSATNASSNAGEAESVENNGEIIAAIAYALELHKEDLHDKESEVITLNSVARVYSPWSSKIHGLTNLPKR